MQRASQEVSVRSYFVGLLVLLLTSSVSAEILAEKFQVERNSHGQVVAIYARPVIAKNLIAFTQGFYQSLINKDIPANKVSTREIVEIARKLSLPGEQVQLSEAMTTIGQYLRQNHAFSPLPKDYHAKLESAFKPLSLPRYRMIAKLYDPTYFYRTKLLRELGEAIVDGVLSLLPGGEYRELATYLVSRTVDFYRDYIKQQRYQLLYYLTHYTPAQLGLRQVEWLFALSSYFEANIPWYKFWDAIKAHRKWESFGQERLSKEIGSARKRLSKHKKRYEKRESLSEFFVTAKFLSGPVRKGREGVLNLFTRANPFTSRPSVAHYFDSPNRIFIQRIVYEALVFAIKFIPVPLLPGALNYYLRKMYHGQILSEGHLLGNLSDLGREELYRLVLRQSINPFIIYADKKNSNEVDFEKVFTY